MLRRKHPKGPSLSFLSQILFYSSVGLLYSQKGQSHGTTGLRGKEALCCAHSPAPEEFNLTGRVRVSAPGLLSSPTTSSLVPTESPSTSPAWVIRLEHTPVAIPLATLSLGADQVERWPGECWDTTAFFPAGSGTMKVLSKHPM